jgi:hypothetical protein
MTCSLLASPSWLEGDAMSGRPHVANRPAWRRAACGPPSLSPPPLVLVHGLLDPSAVFNNSLKRELAGRREPSFIPDLPLRLSRTSVASVAELAGGIGLLGPEPGGGIGPGQAKPGFRRQGVAA